MKDSAFERLAHLEEVRQAGTINLIPSENYISQDIRQALGGIFVNKYAEGYPRARYYAGNAIVDDVEELCMKRALALFGASPRIWNVNVQPYSGTPANLALYTALVPFGAKIMSMDLSMGGHLSHGHAVSVTGKLWKHIAYGVDADSEMIDYNEVRRIAKKERPYAIVAGFTAYSRTVDFKKFRAIAHEVGALLFVDMSHVAGLVAGKAYPSPFPYADAVMTTTHKTLRGPRGAIIFSKRQFSQAVDRAVFPGLQGGPHVNQIAATAVALYEASRPAFRMYARQVIKNSQTLAGELLRLGWRIVSGGTDSHLFLIDVAKAGLDGARASVVLEGAGIIVNKNTIPYDAGSPRTPSGIRIGTPAVTTRGMRPHDMKKIAMWIDGALRGEDDGHVAREVATFAKKFPLP